MSDEASRSALDDDRLEPLVEYIDSVQHGDGLIPWYPDGPADPWDHVESAMGLSIGGRHEAARAAYSWLAENQLDDGSWWASYGDDGDHEGAHDDGEPRKETHRTAYVAVGVWHHYCVTGDRAFLESHWDTVSDALEFALDHQSATGEIFWAVDRDGEVYEDALISGCASIYKSLECGAAMADEVGDVEVRDRWLSARADLGEAVRTRPDRFDRTWESKSRYAMDWFYPILCGVVSDDDARDRVDEGIDRFLEPGLGCLCVEDEPWVTVAESCELVVSLKAIDRPDRAREIYEWLFQWTDENGVFWTGYQFEDEEFWPGDRPTWTAGAALLAADALDSLTAADDLFLESHPESRRQREE